MSHFAYVLKCADNTYYCGYAHDLERRIAEHNSKDKGAKYTKGRQPVKLVYAEKFSTRSEAQKREYELKQLSHSEKATLSLCKE